MAKDRKILLVDDDEDVRITLGRRLKARGFAVETAGSGPEALQKVRGSSPDLILLDAIMPEMDGYATCAELQKNPETSRIPVIFVTALEEERDKAQAFSVGATDYLAKPVDDDSLLQKVESAFQTGDRWKALATNGQTARRIPESDFLAFRQFLQSRLDLPDNKIRKLDELTPFNVYPVAQELGVTGSRMAQLIGIFLKLEYVHDLNPENLQLGVLPVAFCRSNLVVPITDAQGKMLMVASNPFNWELMDLLQQAGSTESPLRLAVTEPENIVLLLRKSSLPTALKRLTVLGSDAGEEAENLDKLVASARDVSVIQLANSLIIGAIQKGASDIHIEPREEGLAVRYRLDGMLVEQEAIAKPLMGPLLSRFKIMANMDIAERRVPQDGRARVAWNTHSVDLRISSLPTLYGEKIVIRVLDSSAMAMDLNALGFEERELGLFVQGIEKPHGMILVTGPTGSGKTTTLYTALSILNKPDSNIVTVEDPIEYQLRRVNQVQVRPEAGLTFPLALRSILRQDPDIIMIGEIRDFETLDIAVKAALTGHLVLSTLHTNDAPSTPVRLIDMGTEPFLVASSLEMVTAQRLLRKLCPWCRKRATVPGETIRRYGIQLPEKAAFHQAVGCERCGRTGYKGRVAATEIMPVDDGMRQLIGGSAGVGELRRYAVERGFTTLIQDAFTKAARGITSVEEVLRMTA